MYRPANSNFRIIPADPSLTCAVILRGAFVDHMRFFAQSDKSVRESRRHPQHFGTLIRQFDPHPFPEERRVLPDIDRHIPYFSMDDAYQFPLRMRWKLKMKPAENITNRV